MYYTRPVYTEKFLKSVNLGVELHITRDDVKPNWEKYIPFVGAVHLPYETPKKSLNIAAFDDELRKESIAILKSSIDKGLMFNVDRMVMHPVGIKSQGGKELGSYDRLISGLQDVAAYAKEKNIILCVENQLMCNPTDRVFGVYCDEWLQIQKDVDRDNVLLTLDTSHASTAVCIYETYEERLSKLYEFLQKPELIGRVHWADSKIKNREALYNDMHLVVGMGDLPLDFHKRIKALPVIKTLEQNKPEEEMTFSLDFINNKL